MKRTLIAFFSISLLFVSATFFSCKINVDTPTQPENPVTQSPVSDKPATEDKEPEEIKIKTSFSDSADFSDSAAPLINFDDYTFDIKAVSGKTETTVFENKTYADLISEKAEIKAGTYIFTIKAYKNDVSVFYGTSESIKLEKEEKNICFVLKPEKGLKGSVELKVFFPPEVKKIEAAWSSDITGTHTSSEKVFETEDFSDNEDGSKCILSILDDLDSGLTQFAVFKFYDAMNTQIGSYGINLIIAGGLKSTKDIVLSKEDLNSHPVSLFFTCEEASLPLSGKTVSLINDKGVSYILNLSAETAVFSAFVPEGEYKIFIDGINSHLSVSVNADTLNEETFSFKKVSIPSTQKVTFTFSETFEGGILSQEENTCFIPENVSGPEVTVTPNTGYKFSASGFSINGNTVTDANLEKEGFQFILSSDYETVTCSGIEAIVYNITYNETEGVNWAPDYSLPLSFTIENSKDIKFPTSEKLSRNGFIFEGWKDSAGQNITGLSENFTGNLSVTASWKTGVFIDTENKTLYAQGLSLYVKENNGKTEIWYDFNRNKMLDEEDSLVMINTDFTGYSVKACNKDNSVPDIARVNFTVTGGTLTGLEGLGKEAIVNVYLSGKPVIGNDEKGIILSSFNNAENILVDGPLSKESLISIVTQNQYTAGTTFCMAYLEKENYAERENFKVLFMNEGNPEIQSVAFKNYMGNRVLYLSSPTGVGMPNENDIIPGVNVEGGLIWEDDGNGNLSKTRFTLGESLDISTNSPVFSIKAENGSFILSETSLKDAEGNILTENLAELKNPEGAQKYHTELAEGSSYKYLHMLSKDNKITPEAVTAFIKSIVFCKDSEDSKIAITINIETMQYAEIEAKCNAESDNFKYYDGSFYLRVDSGYIDWHDAYNNAKLQVFNGLHGYLMTITSEVENFYIFNQLNAQRAWMGGTRFKPDAGKDFDDLSINVSNGATPAFYWACGPEAGQMIYNGVRRTTADISLDSQAFSNAYTNFMNSGFSYYNDTDKVYKTISAHEPNNGDVTDKNTAKETCLQFFKEAGWNDMPEKIVGVYDNPDSVTNAGKDWGFSPKSYVVEFRPYDNGFTTETPVCAPVTMTGNY